MSRKETAAAALVQQEENRKFILESEAHLTRNLKKLLVVKGWLRFKLYVAFKKKKTTDAVRKRSMHANEHRCTYNQLIAGHVSQIILRPAEGYRLINELLMSYRHEAVSIKLYMRKPETGGFDVLCREYYNGKIIEHFSPVLSEDEIVEVPFTIEGGRVLINPLYAETEGIDFGAEVKAALE